jgi:hypothetical protein
VIKETVKVVLETCPFTGAQKITGYTNEESTGVLQSYPMDAINPEDGTTGRYILAVPTAVPLLDAAAIASAIAANERHVALSKLTDEELSVLGISR